MVLYCIYFKNYVVCLFSMHKENIVTQKKYNFTKYFFKTNELIGKVVENGLGELDKFTRCNSSKTLQ